MLCCCSCSRKCVVFLSGSEWNCAGTPLFVLISILHRSNYQEEDGCYVLISILHRSNYQEEEGCYVLLSILLRSNYQEEEGVMF
jgi:hypothetical protein